MSRGMNMIIETLELATSRDYDEPEKGSEEKAVSKPDFVQWVKVGERSFFPVGEEENMKTIPTGVYEILYNGQRGYYLRAKEVKLDDLFLLPDNVQQEVMGDIKQFWAQKDKFKKYGYIYKRGILLYGPPGTGKSSIINLISDEVITNQNGIVLFLNTPSDLGGFNAIMPILRQIEPHKQVVCVIEDIETFTAHRDMESQLLQTLSGTSQIDNIVFLATTNYPEKLEERVTNRPSRFDRRYKIGFPTAEARKSYFMKKLTEEDLATIDLNLWVEKTENLSIAHLGEIVKSVCALGNTFEDTIKLLQEMKQKISSFDFDTVRSESVGFKTTTKHKSNY